MTIVSVNAIPIRTSVKNMAHGERGLGVVGTLVSGINQEINDRLRLFRLRRLCGAPPHLIDIKNCW